MSTALTTRLPRTGHSFPRPLLWAAAGLIGFVLLVAALSRLNPPHQVPADGVAVAQRHLLFVDRTDGGVDVIDADRHALIRTVTGQAGFLRASVRGLASARLRAGIGDATPFVLTAWRDGRLTLDDPTDARHVELEAFGSSNEAVFTDLLTHPETPR